MIAKEREREREGETACSLLYALNISQTYLVNQLMRMVTKANPIGCNVRLERGTILDVVAHFPVPRQDIYCDVMTLLLPSIVV